MVLLPCCGPRRAGDVADFVERFAAEEGLLFIVLAVDPCVDSRRDLCDPVAYQALLEECLAGHVAGVMASPPCSTYSRARHRQVSGGGPRPLRGRSDCFCLLPGLTPAERAAGALGTHLVFVCFALMLAAGRAGARTTLEHPADPGRSPFPSISIAESCDG